MKTKKTKIILFALFAFIINIGIFTEKSDFIHNAFIRF